MDEAKFLDDLGVDDSEEGSDGGRRDGSRRRSVMSSGSGGREQSRSGDGESGVVQSIESAVESFESVSVDRSEGDSGRSGEGKEDDGIGGSEERVLIDDSVIF